MTRLAELLAEARDFLRYRSPFILRRTSEEHEKNAFDIGVDAGANGLVQADADRLLSLGIELGLHHLTSNPLLNKLPPTTRPARRHLHSV